MSAEAAPAPAPAPVAAASFRSKLVEMLHTLNLVIIMTSSLAFVFFAQFLTANADLTPTRVSGAYGLVFGLLIKSLGPMHHGQYCLTFVLHFALASVYGFEAFQQRAQMGTDQWNRLALPSAVHYTMFSVMILLLVNGGLGGKKHESKKKL